MNGVELVSYVDEWGSSARPDPANASPIDMRRCEVCCETTKHQHIHGWNVDLLTQDNVPTDWDCAQCRQNGSRRKT